MSLLQFSHDYTKVGEAYALLYLALEALRFGPCADVKKEILAAREALSDYLSRDNMRPAGDVENGWVKMDDALQLTFTREQLDCIRWYLGERLKEFPGNELALVQLGIINRCQELLNCPSFDSVREFVSNDLGNWSKSKLPL